MESACGGRNVAAADGVRHPFGGLRSRCFRLQFTGVSLSLHRLPVVHRLLRSFHFAMARRVTGYRGVQPPIFLMGTLKIEGRLGGTITIKLKNGRVIGSDKKIDHTFTVNYNGPIAEYIKY